MYIIQVALLHQSDPQIIAAKSALRTLILSHDKAQPKMQLGKIWEDKDLQQCATKLLDGT